MVVHGAPPCMPVQPDRAGRPRLGELRRFASRFLTDKVCLGC
ncbi:hypothetical protein SL1157_2467 [Ruegeria lacuscaerulensis ITI-1157]|nr:hypothetical protein SL1157_2467 [Ruegeria lacuscaerulensis ITI-1157]